MATPSQPDAASMTRSDTSPMRLDAGDFDAAAADAMASADAAAEDATSADAAAPDARTFADAAAADARATDAAAPDAMSIDSGALDSGAQLADASVDPCAEIAAEYAALTAPSMMRCGGAGQCQILHGHCGVGLGGCYYALNTNVSQRQLDDLANRWTAARCRGPVCRCTAPPTSVRCDSGGCLAR